VIWILNQFRLEFNGVIAQPFQIYNESYETIT